MKHEFSCHTCTERHRMCHSTCEKYKKDYTRYMRKKWTIRKKGGTDYGSNNTTDPYQT